MKIVSKETFEEIKSGVTLLRDVSMLTLSAATDKAELKHGHKTIFKENSVKVQRKPLTEREKKVLESKIAVKTNVRDTKWQTATKTAKVTAKVTATCAVALVGGLFAAIIAD